MRLAARKISVQPSSLLSVYAALPLALLCIAIDFLFLDQEFRLFAPDDPNTYAIFTIIFTMPHIIASFFSFLDKDYQKAYGKRMLRGGQLSFLALVFLPLIGPHIAFLVFATLTMIHVLFQQSGIARSLMRNNNPYHTYWQWAGAAISCFLYFDVYSTYSISNPIMIGIISTLAVAFMVLGVLTSRSSTSSIGTQYFWATHALVLFTLVFFWLGYPILVIAIPRIVHDFTAYLYYTAHDHNRYLDKPNNLLYKATSKLKIPVLLASPICSLLLAGMLQLPAVEAAVLPLVSFIILMHYHTESYIWKSGTMHRRYINYEA